MNDRFIILVPCWGASGKQRERAHQPTGLPQFTQKVNSAPDWARIKSISLRSTTVNSFRLQIYFMMSFLKLELQGSGIKGSENSFVLIRGQLVLTEA